MVWMKDCMVPGPCRLSALRCASAFPKSSQILPLCMHTCQEGGHHPPWYWTLLSHSPAQWIGSRWDSWGCRIDFHNIGMFSPSNHHLLLSMLGSSLAAVFLVMKHHLKELSLASLEETAPSVLLTCLSFLPRTSRLPRATCNNIPASVLTSLNQILQLGQPSSMAHLCWWWVALHPLHLPLKPGSPGTPCGPWRPVGPRGPGSPFLPISPFGPWRPIKQHSTYVKIQNNRLIVSAASGAPPSSCTSSRCWPHTCIHHSVAFPQSCRKTGLDGTSGVCLSQFHLCQTVWPDIYQTCSERPAVMWWHLASLFPKLSLPLEHFLLWLNISYRRLNPSLLLATVEMEDSNSTPVLPRNCHISP